MNFAKRNTFLWVEPQVELVLGRFSLASIGGMLRRILLGLEKRLIIRCQIAINA